MSVRWTTSDKVAMFDSVTDRAFGPVFDSEEDVIKFLTWISEQDSVPDVRKLSDIEIELLVKQWTVEADDDENEED